MIVFELNVVTGNRQRFALSVGAETGQRADSIAHALAWALMRLGPGEVVRVQELGELTGEPDESPRPEAGETFAHWNERRRRPPWKRDG